MFQIQGGSSQPGVADILEVGATVFALALFALSMYAWSGRRQTSLIVVALAFFLFFLKGIIELILPPPADDLPTVFLDFAVLALFFTAIILRPRRAS